MKATCGPPFPTKRDGMEEVELSRCTIGKNTTRSRKNQQILSLLRTTGRDQEERNHSCLQSLSLSIPLFTI
jgi:hypothetical protein